MSNYCWMMHIEGSGPAWNGLKVAALNVPPAIDDPRVSLSRPEDYKVTEGVIEGIEYVHIEVRFDTEADATEFYDNARGLQGIFTACDSGYTHVHECYRPGLGCRIIPGKEVTK